MPRPKRRCPCNECDGTGFIDIRTYKKHKAELDDSTRRYAPNRLAASVAPLQAVPVSPLADSDPVVVDPVQVGVASVLQNEEHRRQYACQMAEQLALGRVLENGLDSVLKITAQFWTQCRNQRPRLRRFRCLVSTS
jgi:hypothetical protein